MSVSMATPPGAKKETTDDAQITSIVRPNVVVEVKRSGRTKPRAPVIINLTDCKYECVRRVADEKGWTILNDEPVSASAPVSNFNRRPAETIRQTTSPRIGAKSSRAGIKERLPLPPHQPLKTDRIERIESSNRVAPHRSIVNTKTNQDNNNNNNGRNKNKPNAEIKQQLANNWNVYWTDTSVSVERVMRLQRFQRINHFPGMHHLARKGGLGRLLSRLQRHAPKEFKFVPPTWTLPAEWNSFRSQFTGKANRTFIVKPDAACQGRGIFLTRTWSNVDQIEPQVAQRYLHKPLLIDGCKFDVRIYVVVTSVDPLKIYLFHDGLVRICTEKYVPPTGKNLACSRMHLTNYAINKESTKFVPNKTVEQDHEGHKRSLLWLRRYLTSCDKDADKLWAQMDDLVVKTLLSALPHLEHTYRTCSTPARTRTSSKFERSAGAIGLFGASGTTRNAGTSAMLAAVDAVDPSANGNILKREGKTPPFKCTPRPSAIEACNVCGDNIQREEPSKCFEILGLDIMIDHKLQPWLIEVNHSPSFACESPLDEKIKGQLVRRVLNMLRVKSSDRRTSKRKDAQQAKLRLYTGKRRGSAPHLPNVPKFRSRSATGDRSSFSMPSPVATPPSCSCAELHVAKAKQEQWDLKSTSDGALRRLYPVQDDGVKQKYYDNLINVVRELTAATQQRKL